MLVEMSLKNQIKIKSKVKINFHKILCEEVLWTQYKILWTHKLKYNDLNHVNNVIFIYVILDWSWNTTWYLKDGAKKIVPLGMKKTLVGGIIRSTCR